MKKGRQGKFKERSGHIERENKGLEIREDVGKPYIVLSLKDFENTQGQTFEQWEKDELLSLAITKLQMVCSLTRQEATRQQIIKEYPKGTFPPDSDFYHPKHIAPDIAWYSMHIQGKECVIGYFTDHIFNIVFLDQYHKFWKSRKRGT